MSITQHFASDWFAEVAARRALKNKPNDAYYRHAKPVLWAEWKAGQELRKADRTNTGRVKTDLTVKSVSALLKDHSINPNHAYRWIDMSHAPREVFAEALAEMEDRRLPLIRSELIKIGRRHKPVSVDSKTDITEGLSLGDFRNNDILDESVDLIFTDPPYDRKGN